MKIRSCFTITVFHVLEYLTLLLCKHVLFCGKYLTYLWYMESKKSENICHFMILGSVIPSRHCHESSIKFNSYPMIVKSSRHVMSSHLYSQAITS